MIQINIDGQNFPLPDEIGANDDLIRAALAPFVPWIANAQVQRKTEGENTTVTVVKRADTKGSANDVLDALITAPQERNPAIELWARLENESKHTDASVIVEWQPIIAEAIEQGERDVETIRAALVYLAECAPTPAGRIPLGF